MEKEIITAAIKAIGTYNALDIYERKACDKEIFSDRYALYNEYADLCNSDDELCQAMQELERIREILSFNFQGYFMVFDHVCYAFDDECSEEVSMYSEKKFERYKYAAENREKIEAELLAKIEKIKSKKYPKAFKNRKIQKLEAAIEDCKMMAEHYNLAVEKEQERKKYAENKETLVAPLEKLVEERTRKYAQQVAAKNIQKLPSLARVQHKGHISRGKDRQAFPNEPLNEIYNKIRAEARKQIRKNSEETF